MPPPDDEIEVVGNDEPFANVFNIWTGEKYEPPEPTPREKIVAKENDDQAIDMIMGLQEDFLLGKNHGLIAVVGEFDEKGNLANYRMLLSDTVCSYPISFLGAIEQVKLSIADMALDITNEGSHPEPPESLDLEDLFD